MRAVLPLIMPLPPRMPVFLPSVSPIMAFAAFDLGMRMVADELPSYLADVEAMKLQYKDRMPILSGLEIEYLPSQNEWYKTLFEKYHVDYLALGEHIYETADGSFKNIYNADSTADYLDYAGAVAAGMRSGYFAFAAHPDLMFINDYPWDDNCEKACDILISTAKELDFILEYNANGYRRGLQDFCDGVRYPYPHRRFWEKAAAAGIRTIINSDCHDPKQVWDEAMDQAWKDTAALGLHMVTSINGFR